MNAKTISCLVVVAMMMGMVYATMWMNTRMSTMQSDALQAKQAADFAMVSLTSQQRQLDDLRSASKELINYLKTWEPFFQDMNSPEDAELKISLRIKQDNLVSLSQRYEVATLKGNPSINQVLLAHLSFEDDFARLLNWIGEMGVQLPTMRIDNLRIVQGTRPSDIKVDTVLELPLKLAK